MNPVDEVNISVKVAKQCPEELQQLYRIRTLDWSEEENINFVIRCTCSMEGTKEVNVPVLPEVEDE